MTVEARWLDRLLDANRRFRARVSPDTLPAGRTPGALAIVTCIDPRVNLAAIGIPPFGPRGESDSAVRVLRTAGAMSEARSFVIGSFLAGIREYAIMMHTDCGCWLAYSRIDTIIDNMQQRLSPENFARFKDEIGAPFPEKLRVWLKAFEDPHTAVRDEVAALRSQPYVPDDTIIHGLVYDIETGGVELVVNGYETAA